MQDCIREYIARFGMAVGISLLGSGLCYGNALASGAPASAAGIPPLPAHYTVMTLGDSMTAGYQATSIGGYRGTLHDHLSRQGVRSHFIGSANCGYTALLSTSNQNCDGVGGNTIAMLDARVQTGIVKTLHPDVILLLIGFNSLAYTYNTVDQDLAELSGVIDDIYAQKSNVRLVVASLIASPQCCAQQLIVQYNAGIPGLVAAKAALGFPVTFVDMYPVVPQNDFADYVHPTPAGYKLMAGAWLTAVNATAAASYAGEAK